MIRELSAAIDAERAKFADASGSRQKLEAAATMMRDEQARAHD